MIKTVKKKHENKRKTLDVTKNWFAIILLLKYKKKSSSLGGVKELLKKKTKPPQKQAITKAGVLVNVQGFDIASV